MNSGSVSSETDACGDAEDDSCGQYANIHIKLAMNLQNLLHYRRCKRNSCYSCWRTFTRQMYTAAFYFIRLFPKKEDLINNLHEKSCIKNLLNYFSKPLLHRRNRTQSTPNRGTKRKKSNFSYIKILTFLQKNGKT